MPIEINKDYIAILGIEKGDPVEVILNQDPGYPEVGYYQGIGKRFLEILNSREQRGILRSDIKEVRKLYRLEI